MFDFLKKKVLRGPYSVLDLTDEQKAKIDTLIENGMQPKFIAKDLNLDVSVVYKYNELQNRKARLEAPKAKWIEYQDMIEAQKKQFELEMLKKKQEFDLKRAELDYDLKKLELDAMREDLKADQGEDDDGQNEDVMLMNIITSFLQKQQGTQPNSSVPGAVQQIPITSFQRQDLSHEEIKGIIAQVPKIALKTFKAMDPPARKKMALSQFPGLSEASIQRMEEVLLNEC